MHHRQQPDSRGCRAWPGLRWPAAGSSLCTSGRRGCCTWRWCRWWSSRAGGRTPSADKRKPVQHACRRGRREAPARRHLTALVLPPTCMHLSWNQFQLESSSVDLWGGEEIHSDPRCFRSKHKQPRDRPDEAEVHAQGAVDPRAVDAEEHAVRDARPARIFGRTIKTYLRGGGNVR